MIALRMGKDLQCTKAFVSPEAAYQRSELMLYLHMYSYTNDICGYDIRQRRTSAFVCERQSRSNAQYITSLKGDIK